MKPDHKLYKREFEAALANKANWYSQYSEIYLYTIPNRNAFNVAYDYDNAARFENLQIYDFTPVQAAYQRANDLHGLLLPHDRKWGHYVANDAMLKEPLSHQAKVELDNTNELIFEYINSSNLSQEVAAAMLDLVGGTAVLKIDSPSEHEPLKFKCIPAYTTYLAPHQDTEVENVWIKERLPGYVIREKYDYKGTLLSAMEQDPIVFWDVYTGQIRPDRNKDYWYYYSFIGTNYDEIIWEDDSDYRMVMVLRDKVHPGESDGRGIAMDTVWQVRDLNMITRDHRLSLAYKANPPIFVDSSLPVNMYSFRGGLPGAMIPRTPGMPVPLEAFIMPDNPDVPLVVQDLRNQIRNAFMIDPLGDIAQAGEMTATETSLRENRAQRTSTTDISRLIKDLPENLFETAMKILIRWELIPKVISEIKKMKAIKFDFKSPLYDIQAQDELTDLAQALQMGQQYFGPNAVAIACNVGEIIEYLTSHLNLPHRLFKSQTDIEQALAGIAQAAQGANIPGMPPQGALPTPTTAAQQLPQLTYQGVTQ